MPAVSTPLCGRAIARATAALLAGTALLLFASSSALARQPCAGASAAPSPQTLDAAAGAVLCLVNAERASHGRHRLRSDGALRQAAARHSRDMVRRAFFAHVNPNGATVADRLRSTGYLQVSGAWQVGENLAWGTGGRATPDVIVAEWIASPAHRRIMLRRNFRDVGVGVAAGAPDPTADGPGATYTLDTGVTGG